MQKPREDSSRRFKHHYLAILPTKTMKIGELSSKSQVPIKTIRY
ncbi:MAG: hypothetical protein RLZZ176_1700, partial [Cyanobacteriota bacterium]